MGYYITCDKCGKSVDTHTEQRNGARVFIPDHNDIPWQWIDLCHPCLDAWVEQIIKPKATPAASPNQGQPPIGTGSTSNPPSAASNK